MPSTPQAPTPRQDDSRTYPQFQFYAENRLLRHPLVSPVLAYLGGLPPLFFVAGDGEVLRDEIIYTWVISSREICDYCRLTGQHAQGTSRRLP